MEKCSLEDFKEYIRTNREFEFYYKSNIYTMTYEKEGFIFTDENRQEESIYKSYKDLLDSTKIDGLSIEEIIVGGFCDELTIF